MHNRVNAALRLLLAEITQPMDQMTGIK